MSLTVVYGHGVQPKMSGRCNTMISEPYKIKEVKKMGSLRSYERWNTLKKVHFNTFHVSSSYVAFDLVCRGMSSWSHYQKAAYMIGDEAYAGSRNYIHLVNKAKEVLGLSQIVPTHNGIGAEKLLAITMVRNGHFVLHNRGRCEGLVPSNGGISVDVTSKKGVSYAEPHRFGGDVDIEKLEKMLIEKGKDQISYIHVETCPEAWNGQPVSFANFEAVKRLCSSHGVPLVIDISHVLENAYWIQKTERHHVEIMEIAREIISFGDIVLMDASQDCRSDIGGFIASENPTLFEQFRNQVVVFEGLHTYGGMTGRAMEVFAVGISDMEETSYVGWYATQIGTLYDWLKNNGVPVYRGGNGIALDVESFLPHLSKEDNPKFVLAASLYILGGLRGRIDGLWEYHAKGEGRRTLNLELPRNAYTRNHLSLIADVISAVHSHRDEISGLRLMNDPEFVDEAVFQPDRHRLFVSFPEEKRAERGHFEPYKIAIFEPLKITDKAYRKKAMEEAGYNTFLLD